MGRAIAKAALSHDDIVTAVGRSFENTLEDMQNWHPDPNRCQGLLCDIRARETVQHVIQATIERWGRIDIVTICSGYGVIGACEDQDEYEIRNQFETNFMGTLNIIQLSLPYFRERGAGRYLIMSSTSGALGVPGLGPFCATKYAIEGLIESMLYEIDNFNIKATLILPGHLRRDNDPSSSTTPAEPNNATTKPLIQTKLPVYGQFLIKAASEPYATPSAPSAHARRMVQWLNNNQPGSAVKAAELVWQLGHCSFPPLRLLLGSYAVDSVRDRLRSVIEEIEDWKHLSFPAMDQETEAAGGKEESAGADAGREEADEEEAA